MSISVARVVRFSHPLVLKAREVLSSLLGKKLMKLLRKGKLSQARRKLAHACDFGILGMEARTFLSATSLSSSSTFLRSEAVPAIYVATRATAATVVAAKPAGFSDTPPVLVMTKSLVGKMTASSSQGVKLVKPGGPSVSETAQKAANNAYAVGRPAAVVQSVALSKLTGSNIKPAFSLGDVWDWVVSLGNDIYNAFKPIINDVIKIVGDVKKLIEDLKGLFEKAPNFAKTLRMAVQSSPRAGAYAAKAAADAFKKGAAPTWMAYDAAANAHIANGGLQSWLSAEDQHSNQLNVTWTGPAGPVRSWGKVQRYSRPCVDGSGHEYVASRTTVNGGVTWGTRLIALY